MKKSPDHIDGKLSDLPSYKVSAEKDREILNAINNSHLTANSNPVSAGSESLFLNFIFNMKKLSAVVAAVVILLAVSIYNSQSSFADYLEGAQGSLDELKAALADGQITDDEDVASLINSILDNAQKASEAAADIDDENELKSALEDLDDLYEDANEAFHDVADATDDETLDELASSAISASSEEEDEEEEEDHDSDSEDHEANVTPQYEEDDNESTEEVESDSEEEEDHESDSVDDSVDEEEVKNSDRQKDGSHEESDAETETEDVL